MSSRRVRGRTATLPRPLPADLVEARPAWPELEADELERLLAGTAGLGSTVAGDAAARLTATTVAGAAAARLALDGRLTRERADDLVNWAARFARLATTEARVQLFVRAELEVLASAQSSSRAIDGLLGVLAALAPAEGVQLVAAGRPVRPPVGEVPPGAHEIPIPEADAVLLVHPADGSVSRCRAFAEETARILAAPLRARTGRSSAELAKLEAAQRRLRRLALDLHDGPAQDVAALAADAVLLEADLGEELSPERLNGLRELAADIRDRLAGLGREIRDLAEVLEPRAILREPIARVLASEAATFARRSGITPTLDVDEELGVMTASQQIALVRVAQEALTNVRDHAGAKAVHVSARATPSGVSLVVLDDGRGFDVAARAASGLGLAGMDERVRLLGGRLVVESRRGGPTRVEATIPRWRPSA